MTDGEARFTAWPLSRRPAGSPSPMSEALENPLGNRAAQPPRRTALDALHRALGATMTDFAGWDMPLRYASEREEHQAVRTRAGLFDLSHMGEITVTGPDSGQALDYALVGHLS